MIATNIKKIVLQNTIEEVQIAIQLFEEFAEIHALPIPTAIKVNIVLDELLSNIVKYGFPDENTYKIEINLELSGNGGLSIIISDNGIPFNPFQKTPPDLSIPLEEREIGGLGIHLVKQLMDTYTYKRELDSNIICMTKNSF